MMSRDYSTSFPGNSATFGAGVYSSQNVNIARAGFWRRASAWVFDLLAVDCLYAAFFAIGQAGLRLGLRTAGTTEPSMDLIEDLIVPNLILWVVLYTVYVGFFTRSQGQTPGKMLADIRVIDRHCHAPSLRQAWCRPLGYALSGLPFGLGFLVAAVPPSKAALHDLLSGTRVVRVSRVS